MTLRRSLLALAALCGVVAGPGSPALAHTALMSCYDNGDGTVSCEAGYSDGASSAGQVIRVLESNGRLIMEGVFDTTGTYTFKLPDTDFYVEFEGDIAHIVRVDGAELVK